MNCPCCKNIVLMRSDKHGVEIDFCPNCRGIWLDKGELEKIIERDNLYANQNTRFEKNYDDDYSEESHHDRNYKGHNDDKYRNEHDRRKKRGFLSDLFDF